MGHFTVEILGGVCLCVTGLSHWLHAEAWCRFFARLAEKGTEGALCNGLMHGGVGALFLATHPVFVGWHSILTYWALLLVAKGLIYLAWPEVGLRSMRRCTPDAASQMKWVAIPLITLGLLIIVIAVIGVGEVSAH